MASSSNREAPPWRALVVFFLLMIVVYGLVFFTGSREATPKLGIDLQGGTRVTLTARTPDGSSPSRDQLNKAKEIIEQRVNGLGVSGSEVVVTGDNLVITVPGDDGQQARTLGQTALLYVRPVDGAPVAATPQPAPTGDEVAPEDEIAAARAARQAPADASPERIEELRAYMAKMNCDPAVPDPLQGNDDPEQYLVACSEDGTQVYLLEPQILKGDEIKSAEAGTTQGAGAWIVRLDYKGGASERWSKYTAANIGKATAFTLDSRVVSAPQINGAISGTTEVSGNFSQSEAKDLANVLKYGSLPLSFEASDAETVSATLGWSSLRAGLIAGLVGLIAVFIYALAYYRMLGILTVLSLVMSGIMVYGIMVLLGRYIGFSLDLAGIAGLVIGIGMTADSFVVYFERIKDEMREGRSFRSAVPRGWARAKRTIWSGNAVSLISAAVLYFLAVGEVRGFAFTLGLTTILDVAVVFLVTYPLVVYASRSKFLSKPNVNGLGAVTAVARERRQAAATERPTSTSGGVRNG